MRLKKIIIPQWLHLPKICALCQHYHQNSQSLCQSCLNQLVRIEVNSCQICSLPLPSNTFLLCGSCIIRKPAFDKVFTNFSFEEPLRTLLHNFKYKNALYLRYLLVELMLEALPNFAYKPECLIPVPMHAERLRERGFNQALELAKLLAKKLKIPCNKSLCKKLKNTPQQAGLTSAERLSNLKKAFFAMPNCYGHVTIIDDLLTTGSTANELAKVLKKTGVHRVDIWCLARTPSSADLK